MKGSMKKLTMLTMLVLAVSLMTLGEGQALAGEQPKFAFFKMDDRFATEQTGASGFGKIRAAQEDCIEVTGINAKGLTPNQEYEFKVTISDDPEDFPNNIVRVVTSSPIDSDEDGDIEISNLALGCFSPGNYRVDLFVTHTFEPTELNGPIAVALERDPLLACIPAPVVRLTTDPDPDPDPDPGEPNNHQ